MESLLQKLGKEKTKNENQQENRAPNSESENPQSGNRASDEGVRGPQATPIAHPCPSCGATIAWWDRYGGGPHCHRCRDWPTTAVVRAIAVAVDGRWMTFAQANASLAASQGRGEESIDLDGQEASCGHRRRRNVACYPVVARDGAVVVDRDRLAEAERFVECLDCGKWISRI
jgi:hypothetical protein